jgi:hypothetical protein
VDWRDGDIIGINPRAVYCYDCDGYEEPLPNNVWPFEVGQHFLPALINGDETGLSHNEIVWLNEFEKKETRGLVNWHWSYNPDHSKEFGECEITGVRGATVELHLVEMG